MTNVLMSIIAIAEGIGLLTLATLGFWAYRKVTRALALTPATSTELRHLIAEAETLATRIAKTFDSVTPTVGATPTLLAARTDDVHTPTTPGTAAAPLAPVASTLTASVATAASAPQQTSTAAATADEPAIAPTAARPRSIEDAERRVASGTPTLVVAELHTQPGPADGNPLIAASRVRMADAATRRVPLDPIARTLREATAAS